MVLVDTLTADGMAQTGHLVISDGNRACCPDGNYWDFYPILNTLRQRQNGRHIANDIFKCIFLNENTSISINISLKFVPEGQINNIPALVQIMAWRRLGAMPLSEPIMVSLLMHICVTRPQWVKSSQCRSFEDWAPVDFIYGCSIFKWVA